MASEERSGRGLAKDKEQKFRCSFIRVKALVRELTNEINEESQSDPISFVYF